MVRGGAGRRLLVVDARELQRDKPSYTIDTLERCAPNWPR
jgi:nicotinic acid mononucleotide adenylyltransferase